MSLSVRSLILAEVLVVLLGAPHGAGAQVEIQNNFKYSSGQSVQPIFEGWSRSPDGAVTMHFGYLNRNYVEQPQIPIGSGNSIEPGGPDRGQPTYFYPRINRNLFSVTLPKDWGKKELIWTLTVNGKTEKAIGWLQPEWEIDPAGGTQAGRKALPGQAPNKPPTLTIEPAAAITLPDTATFTALVADDGLPKIPQRKLAIGQESPPMLQTTKDAPVNLPELGPAAVRGPRGPQPQGVSVSWIVWRGPGGATFTPPRAQPKDGKSVTTARFTKPGEYIVRVRATDTALTVQRDVKVIVSGSPASNQP